MNEEIWKQIGDDIPGEFENGFGFSTKFSTDGSRLVATGFGREYQNGLFEQLTRVFDLSESELEWVQVGPDIITVHRSSSFRCDISGDGNTVVIGCILSYERMDGSLPSENDDISDLVEISTARAYRFNQNSGEWEQFGSNIPEITQTWTGYDVSINSTGDIMAVSTPFTIIELGTFRGVVQVFKYDGNDWTPIGNDIQLTPIVIQDRTDLLGVDVGLNADGTRVVIGAISRSTTSPETGMIEINNGSITVFEYDSPADEWRQIGQEIGGDESEDSISMPGFTSGSRYGNQVKISSDGSRIMGSAIIPNQNMDYEGIVRTYRYDDTLSPPQWIQYGQDLFDSELIGGQGQRFGDSLGMSDDGLTISISSRSGPSVSGTLGGYVRVFRYDQNTDTWIQLGNDLSRGRTNVETYTGLDGDGKRVALASFSYVQLDGNRGLVQVFEFTDEITANETVKTTKYWPSVLSGIC